MTSRLQCVKNLWHFHWYTNAHIVILDIPQWKLNWRCAIKRTYGVLQRTYSWCYSNIFIAECRSAERKDTVCIPRKTQNGNVIPQYPTWARVGNSERGKEKQKVAPRHLARDIWKVLLKEKQLLHFLNSTQSYRKTHLGKVSWASTQKALCAAV